MIKETGTLHFQYRTINGSQHFPPHPRQLRGFSILYLIWLYWMNLILQSCVWTEQLPTGFIIHSSVNKLRDIYALRYLLCFFHFHRILICFNWTLTSHAYCISYNHLGCWSNTGRQFIVVVVWFFTVSFYIYTALPLDSLKSLHTGRSNAGMYKNDLFKPTNHFMRAKCLNTTVFFNYLCTFWPLMTFLIASVLMCGIPYDC